MHKTERRKPTRRPVVGGKKLCLLCDKWVSVDQFRLLTSTHARQVNPDQRDPRCNDCRKLSMIARNFVLPLEEVRARRKATAQCDICGAKPKPHAFLSIDHCHKTGQLRGNLCTLCNHMLGAARDRLDLMRRGVGYLMIWEMNHNKTPVTEDDIKRRKQLDRMYKMVAANEKKKVRNPRC